jgi:hypothetical protein
MLIKDIYDEKLRVGSRLDKSEVLSPKTVNSDYYTERSSQLDRSHALASRIK